MHFRPSGLLNALEGPEPPASPHRQPACAAAPAGSGEPEAGGSVRLLPLDRRWDTDEAQEIAGSARPGIGVS